MDEWKFRKFFPLVLFFFFFLIWERKKFYFKFNWWNNFNAEFFRSYFAVDITFELNVFVMGEPKNLFFCNSTSVNRMSLPVCLKEQRDLSNFISQFALICLSNIPCERIMMFISEKNTTIFLAFSLIRFERSNSFDTTLTINKSQIYCKI